tara:strand:+ start:1109 stop:1414 length:306 start_codon:yes stop_codon:yes gene_type:complete
LFSSILRKGYSLENIPLKGKGIGQKKNKKEELAQHLLPVMPKGLNWSATTLASRAINGGKFDDSNAIEWHNPASRWPTAAPAGMANIDATKPIQPIPGGRR